MDRSSETRKFAVHGHVADAMAAEFILKQTPDVLSENIALYIRISDKRYAYASRIAFLESVSQMSEAVTVRRIVFDRPDSVNSLHGRRTDGRDNITG